MNISDLAEDYLVDRKEVLRKLTACNRPRRGSEEMKSFTACFHGFTAGHRWVHPEVPLAILRMKGSLGFNQQVYVLEDAFR